MSFFDYFKKQKDPYKYKMLCKKCDIFFEVKNPEKERKCPACNTSNQVDVYSLINKETGKEIL